MDALIVYGSLINESELVQGGFCVDRTCPVIVQGFKRIFRQEPSWRRSDLGKERAVLNAVSSRSHWLNGLLIWGLDDDFFTDLDEREKGYQRIEVDPSSLRRYGSSSTTSIPQNIYIYTGDMDKQSNSILPNESYLRTCLEGAEQWGEDFYSDFLHSTFVRDNVLLNTYLE
jgi:hypothetical protein